MVDPRQRAVDRARLANVVKRRSFLDRLGFAAAGIREAWQLVQPIRHCPFSAGSGQGPTPPGGMAARQRTATRRRKNPAVYRWRSQGYAPSNSPAVSEVLLGQMRIHVQ